jgi:hypothetical protein
MRMQGLPIAVGLERVRMDNCISENKVGMIKERDTGKVPEEEHQERKCQEGFKPFS